MFLFFNQIKQLLKNLLKYTIKFDFLLIYTFSKTPLYFIYLFFVILGFFGGKESTTIHFYFLVVVTYITGTATLIFLVSTSKSTRRMVESLVGSFFMERFAPRNGWTNLLLLVIPIFFFLFIEICTIEYQMYNIFKVYESYSLVVRDLTLSADFKTAQYLHEKQLKILEPVLNVEGLMCHIAKNLFQVLKN